MSTVADVVAARLSNEGVRALFGVPGGGGNLDLIDAAGRAGVPFVLTATETAAAIAAMAQAEITGRPGACLTTLGPGVASAVNGVACAFLDRAPLVVFTDGYADGHVFEHQRLRHRALLGSLTKASVRLSPAGAVQAMGDAIVAALSPPPGPVHVECPGDVLRQPVEASADLGAMSPEFQDDPRVSRLVSRARKPLLLVGLGARAADAAGAVRALVDRGIPAMVTYKAKGVVPDRHPMFAGVLTNGAIEQRMLGESDLLVGVGLDPVELLPRPWTAPAPVLALGRWPVGDTHVPFAAQAVGDLALILEHVGTWLSASEWAPGAAAAHASRMREAVRSGVAGGLSPARVVEMAAERLAGRARVTVDAGAHMFPSTLLWPVGEPNGMLISNGLSTMGFALPAAVGASLVDRDRPVVALTGDGGLLMAAGELVTIARERLRVIVVVFNDGALSLIDIKQRRRGFVPAGVSIGTVDWCALARSVGIRAWSASEPHALAEALGLAVDHDGPALIEAPIDPAAYDAMVRAVRGT
jgi:acetolactate synthase-1/2/3 large subunit